MHRVRHDSEARFNSIKAADSVQNPRLAPGSLYRHTDEGILLCHWSDSRA